MGVQTIHCTVSSCYYNDRGERCKAETIQVRANPAAGGGGRFEVGELGGGAAGASAQTQCHTFIPRDQGPKPGVRRMED